MESQSETMPESFARNLLEQAARRNRDSYQEEDESSEAQQEQQLQDDISPEKSIPRDTNEDENVRLPETIPESIDANRRVSQLSQRTPHLSSQQSAPGNIAKMTDATTMEPAKKVQRRASLSQLDTQSTEEFPSQLVKSWTAPEGSEHAGDTQRDIDDGETQRDMEDEEPKTAQKGDNGYVDLEGAYVGSSPYPETQPAEETQTDFDVFLQSQAPDDSPEDRRFAKPAIPATPAHGLKRGDSLPSGDTTTRTDHFADFNFGPQSALKGQSQIFGMTQNPSSPMPDGPRSDPTITRPSPNFDRQSSPQQSYSSPTETRVRPRSANNEPREQYVSMIESQERHARAKLLEAKLAEQGFLEQEEEDELNDTQDWLRDERRKQTERINANLERFGAPRPTSGSASSRKVKATIDLVTPATEKRGTRVEFDFEDEETEDEEEPVAEEDELPQDIVHEDDDKASEDENDNDEYDELLGEVTRSQANYIDDDENQSVAESVENADVEMEDAQHDGGKERVEALHTQGSTIADSQPNATSAVHETAVTAHVQHSSTISYVPGSQYQGNTSEDQAILASSQRRSQSRIAASQYDNQRTVASGDKMPPSSPPLPPAESTMPEDSAEASVARRELLDQFQQRGPVVQEESTESREIPESDLPDLDRPQTAVPAEDEETQDTNHAPYSTARTHVSGSARSPAKSVLAPSSSKIFMSQQSQSQMYRSPRKFRDMPLLTTHDSSFEQAMADVDDVFEGVVTKEDHMMLDLSSDGAEQQPRTKRRKLDSHASSDDGSSDAHATTTPPTSHTRPDIDMRDRYADSESIGTIAESEPDVHRPEQSSRALKDSPSKANEMPASQLQDDGKTPESQLLREKAGAHAVSQLLAARPEPKKSKAKAATYGKASRRASNSGLTTPKKKSTRIKAAPAEGVDDPAVHLPKTEAGTGESAIFETAEENVMDIDQQPDAAQGTGANADEVSTTNGNEAGQPSAPKRILALFKGAFNNFYPATWVGSSADGMTYKVCFDDGTITNIETQHVRSLHLKVGDTVRVDEPSMKRKTWVVVGFRTTASPGQDPETDIYDHSHVQVQAKASRTSLPAGSTPQNDGEVKEVSIHQIYITHTMWINFDERKFVAPTSGRAGRAVTPATRSSTPSTNTPGSRRRAIKHTAKVKLESRVSHLREASVTSSISASNSGVFSGMAFAISYGDNEAEKAEVTRQIQRNGGLILADGFEELFDLPELGQTSPKKRSPTNEQDAESTSGLQIKARYRSLSFVALIADRHSRRAKYMQALALGLPTLSGRWISHSLDASKNPTIMTVEVAPLAWDKYLLPAGESSYLGGAIRSRTMTTYDPQSSSLEVTINSRPLLLNGETVLLGPPKKGKGGMEKRQTYAFLTRALGAGEVKRVDDLTKVKAMLGDDPALVYVDGDIEEACNVVFGKANTSKKRKRESGAAKEEAKMSLTKDKVKIVNDEFVIQSLILGALVD